MKKRINILILLIIMLFGFGLSVKAENIEDLQSNDIVIGNTRFSANTWISASRAAKAGALYTNNTGNVDIKTYYYVNPELVYVMDDNGDYKPLNEDELYSLYIEMNIYYENNIALPHEYDISEFLYMYYDMSGGNPEPMMTNDGEENPPTDGYTNVQARIEIEEDDISINYEEKTLTCPYGKEFLFSVVYFNDETDLDTEHFIGKCGINGEFDFEHGNFIPTKMSLKTVSLPEDENFLNQNKLEYTIFDKSYISGRITQKLEKMDANIPDYYMNTVGEDYYIVVDLEFDDMNDISKYSIVSDYNRYYRDYNVTGNKIRLYIALDDYRYNNVNFYIVDNNNYYERVMLYFQGIEKQNMNFEVSNVSVADIDDEYGNQSAIAEIVPKEVVWEAGHSTTFYNVNITGDLEYYERGNESKYGSWVALKIDFETAPEYLEEIIINDSNAYHPYDLYEFEVINDELIMWINASAINMSEMLNLQLEYRYNNGNNYTNLNIFANIYLNSVEYANELEGIYQFNNETEDFERIEANTSSSAELYYDSDNNKLYFLNYDYNTIFKDIDNNGKETYRIIYDGRIEEVIGFVYDDDSSSAQLITLKELDEMIEHKEYYENFVLKYFFNRELDEEETEKLNELRTYFGEENIIDVSDHYYGVTE